MFVLFDLGSYDWAKAQSKTITTQCHCICNQRMLYCSQRMQCWSSWNAATLLSIVEQVRAGTYSLVNLVDNSITHILYVSKSSKLHVSSSIDHKQSHFVVGKT